MVKQSGTAKAAFVFGAVFALYFFTRSPGLDNADSVQFAMGVRDFNLWKHQPHPPGYPLYLFFGWIGHALFRSDPAAALHIASCVGGALFIAAWFCIIQMQLGERSAWVIASALAVTPIVWMTSGMVMTDSLAAGLLSVQLLCALFYRQSKSRRDLVFVALAGAAAAGVRPQLSVVVLVVLLTALYQKRAAIRDWRAGILILIAGCLVWLLPMSYLQWKLRPELSWWQVYPTLVYEQWRWRLHDPEVYLGAGPWSFSYIKGRLFNHFVGWFVIGLGFARSTSIFAAGSAIAAIGTAIYFFRLRDDDRAFWKSHRAWAAVHIAIIFTCLPWEQRYYLPIYPLLLVPIALGFARLPGKIGMTAFALPALLACVSLPLALQLHREEAPPIRFVRYLQDRHPAAERAGVLLILHECQRHVQWYAPEFRIRTDASLTKVDPDLLDNAQAVYTDNSDLALTADWKLTPLATFARSDLISVKQSEIMLFKLERLRSDLGAN